MKQNLLIIVAICAIVAAIGAVVLVRTAKQDPMALPDAPLVSNTERRPISVSVTTDRPMHEFLQQEDMAAYILGRQQDPRFLIPLSAGTNGLDTALIAKRSAEIVKLILDERLSKAVRLDLFSMYLASLPQMANNPNGNREFLTAMAAAYNMTAEYNYPSSLNIALQYFNVKKDAKEEPSLQDMVGLGFKISAEDYSFVAMHLVPKPVGGP